MPDPITEDTTSEETATTETESTEQTEQVEQESTEITEGESALGDAGKKALDAMKAQRNAAAKEAKEAKAELARRDAEAELAKKPVEEQELERVRAEATEEATKKANSRILRAELRVAAKGKLADVSDAGLFIDVDDFEVGADGEVDAGALEDAIDDLIASKPHLAAAQRRFGGSADQGAAGKKAGPTQVTKQELSNMSPEQINEARAAGRLNTLLGVSK